MLQFCLVSNSLSHTTIWIKWEVYFSKRLVSLVFIVSSLWFCMHMYMYYVAIQHRLGVNNWADWVIQHWLGNQSRKRKTEFKPLLCLKMNLVLQYHHHHHHVAPPARISLTVSRHFSLSFIASGRSSGLHVCKLVLYQKPFKFSLFSYLKLQINIISYLKPYSCFQIKDWLLLYINQQELTCHKTNYRMS